MLDFIKKTRRRLERRCCYGAAAALRAFLSKISARVLRKRFVRLPTRIAFFVLGNEIAVPRGAAVAESMRFEFCGVRRRYRIRSRLMNAFCGAGAALAS